jgi:hypothetical protein
MQSGFHCLTSRASAAERRASQYASVVAALVDFQRLVTRGAAHHAIHAKACANEIEICLRSCMKKIHVSSKWCAALIAALALVGWALLYATVYSDAD